MTTTGPVGLSAARTASRASRSTSTKAATGKLKTAAAGRAALTYFELALPRRHSSITFSASFPTLILCSKRSPQHSLLGWRWGRSWASSSGLPHSILAPVFSTGHQGGLVPVWPRRGRIKRCDAFRSAVCTCLLCQSGVKNLADIYGFCLKKNNKKQTLKMG